MKIAHYDNTNGKILGWYDTEIHSKIPVPNVEVIDDVWQNAIDSNHNHITVDGVTSSVDFRTAQEIEDARAADITAQADKIIYSAYSQTKQNKMNSQGNFLNNKIAHGIALTADEAALEVWLLSVNTWITSVRTIENNCIADQNIPVDFSSAGVAP